MHRNRRHQVSGSEAVSSEEVRELAPFQGSGSAREVVHQAQEACSAERRPWAGVCPGEALACRHGICLHPRAAPRR